MPIYKYTMKKFFKSISTWVILGITAVIVFAITGPLFFKQLTSNITAAGYQRFADAFFAGILLLIVLFGSIFIGFKGGQVYKDEVEDGTFLIILSKPQSRSRIIFFKWLALSTMSILFLTTVLLSMTIGVSLYGRLPVMSSNGNNISIYHNLLKNNAILFSIGLVIVMILSSLALMISTKVSTGGTIGITIAIGVSVQITGIIGQFSTTSTYNTDFLQNNIKNKEDALTKNMELKSPDKSRSSKYYEPVTQIVNTLYTGALIKGDFTLPGTKTSISGGGLGFIGINVNRNATFNYLAYIDLSYQVSLLSNIATTATSSGNAQNDSSALNAAANNGGPGNIKKQKFVKTYSAFSEIENKVQPLISLANQSIVSWAVKNSRTDLLTPTKSDLLPAFKLDWTYLINIDQLKNALQEANATVPTPAPGTDNNTIIKSYMTQIASDKKLDEIKYVDFINKYAVFTAYIVLAAVLVPVSYFILRRQDFR